MRHNHRSTLKILAALVMVSALLLGVFSTTQAYAVPFIRIDAVVAGKSVTISGLNFPADQTFTVRMGAYGTLGIGGVVVGVKEPAAGSTFTATYDIPASLVGAQKIAIRLDSPQGYYSYNWFYNSSTAPVVPAVPTEVPAAVETPAPVEPTAVPVVTAAPYSGFPTMDIVSVVKDKRVNVALKNIPAGETLTIRMGEFGTAGINGLVVTKISSGKGGDFTATYMIPAALAGRGKIAIRVETASGYYAYNWFFNN